MALQIHVDLQYSKTSDSFKRDVSLALRKIQQGFELHPVIQPIFFESGQTYNVSALFTDLSIVAFLKKSDGTAHFDVLYYPHLPDQHIIVRKISQHFLTAMGEQMIHVREYQR